MQNITKIGLATALIAAFAGTAMAQTNNGAGAAGSAASTDTTTPQKKNSVSLYRPTEIQHLRPADQRGINIFENPK